MKVIESLLIRIKDTLHLKEIWISEGLLDEEEQNKNIEILEKQQNTMVWHD